VRLALAVAREERHELAREPGRGKVRGHHAEQAFLLLDEGGDAWRHRGGPGAEVGMRRRERVDERVEIEQVSYIVLGEKDHDSRFSRPSACWFQGTRWVTPAAPTRSRFARYQS